MKLVTSCRLSALAPALLSLVFITGCERSAPPPSAPAADAVAAQKADECRSRLNGAVVRVSPESMAGQQQRDGVVNAVNSWLASCAETEVRRLAISEPNAAMLSADALRTAKATRFSETDITYIRDCLMLKGLTSAIWKQIETSSDAAAADRQRVTAFFRSVIRHLSLLPTNEARPPVGLYEALLTGRGTVEDRIWAFTEGLRQRQIDCLLLKAATPGNTSTSIIESADWLVLAAIGEDTLLFDPLRGSPVPAAGDTSFPVRTPASLTAIQELDRWKQAAVFAVMHPSAVAPRMLVLQQQMDAADTAVLYEELAGGTSEIRPFLQRIPASVLTLWPAAQIKLWPVPEQRINAAAVLTEEQKQSLQLLLRHFDSPFERASIDRERLLADAKIDESKVSQEEMDSLVANALAEMLQRSDTLFGRPSRRLLKARISQLSGNFAPGMIQELQQIRIASLQESIDINFSDGAQMLTRRIPLPDSILSVQRAAVSDALYWTALTQLSMNDYGTAVQTLRNYRRQYPNSSLQFASQLNEAEALAELGNLASAAEVLAGANIPENPEQVRAAWLHSMLSAAAAAPNP